jgi:poly(3-hydroxybutyrate) depolymerase
MLYTTYQASEDLLAPTRAWASMVTTGSRMVPRAWQPPWIRAVTAVAELTTFDRIRHERPDWAIHQVAVGGRDVAIHEEVADATAFGTLRRFVKEGVPAGPPVLVVAPLSGHFATLLRPTVATLLTDHDVYVTDWHNARDIPVAAGRFDADDYIEHIMRFAAVVGAGAHFLAVCQPCPAVLAATALLSEEESPFTPSTITLMAGPVDCRINPTVVNHVATERPIEWFEERVIDAVPGRYAGRGRRVYPGFLQLGSFLAMNPYLHTKRHLDAYLDLVNGDGVVAETVEAFYLEYNAVLDLTAEFYLQTVERVFQRFELARGVQEFRGRRVDLGAIRSTRVLAIEGERDNICGRGQTGAAIDLCTNVAAGDKQFHIEPGVGHYGVFSGQRWRDHIYPRIRDFVAQ